MVERVIRVRIDPSGAVSGGRQTENALRGIGRRGEQTQRAIGGLTRALASLGVAVGGRELVQLADTFQLLQARLKVVTGSTAAATEAFDALFAISNRTRQSVEATTNLFTRFARATNALGIEQSRVLAVTESISQAVVVSGASATEASGALFQLSQGLAANALRGQELNSVLEQTPRIALAIADGLGVGIGELRKLAEEGQLTAETVVNAIESQAAAIREEFLNIPVTVGQSFQVLQNELLRFIGTLDSSTGATQTLGEAVLLLARNIDILAGALAALAATAALRLLVQFAGVVRRLFRPLNIAIAAIGGLAAGLNRLVGNFDVVIDDVRITTNVFDILGFAVEKVVGLFDGFIVEPVVAGFEAIIDLARDLAGILNINVPDSFEKFKEAGLDALDAIGRGVQRTVAILTPFQNIDDLRRRLDEINRSAPARDAISEFGRRATIDAIQSDTEADQVIRSTERKINDASKAVSAASRDIRRDLELIRAETDLIGSGAADDFFSPQSQAFRDLQKRLTVEAEIEKFVKSNKDATEANVRALRAELLLREDALENLERVTLLREGQDIQRDAERALRVETDLLGKSLDQRRQILALEQARDALRGRSGDPEALAANIVALERVSEQTARQESLLRRLRTPQQDYNDGLRALNAIRPHITAEQFNDELARLNRELLDADRTLNGGVKQGLLDIQDRFGDVAGVVRNEMVGAFQEAEDALVSFFQTGKFGIAELAESIQRSLLRIAVREQITAPIAQALGLSAGGRPQAANQNTPLLGQLIQSAQGVLGFGNNQQSSTTATPQMAAACVGDTLDEICDRFAELDPGETTAELESVLDGIVAQFKSLEASFSSSSGSGLGSGIASGISTLFGGAEATSSNSGFITAIDSSLTGFARGGSFEVNQRNAIANSNGIDNRVVAFRARDGEQVTVTPPGQDGRGAASVTVNFPSVRNFDEFQRNEDQIAASIGQAVQRANSRNRAR